MGLGVYFISGIVLSGLLFLFPRKAGNLIFTLIFLTIQLSLTAHGYINKDKTELSYFTFDSLSLIFMTILSIVSVASLYHSISYLKDSRHLHRSLFYFSFIILNISLTGVYTTNNSIVSWIFIELTTLSAAGLINHNRSMFSLEATWKYVFICSVGIAMAYIGILFASATSDVKFSGDMSFTGLKEAFHNIDPIYMKMAFLLILVGYSSKLEVFPLYTIGIDANYVAPAPVSAFLSSALVNGGFVAFFRIYSVMSGTQIQQWMNHVLLITGLLSLLVSAIYMQKAVNLKRIFAYSTVEHMGIVLIALTLGKTGIFIALLQITFHSFVKSGLFFQTGILHRILKSYKLSKSGGYFRINPAGALILIFGIILIAAVPPSGLFASEFLLLKELGYKSWLIFISVAVLLTFIFYGIFQKNFQILFGKPQSLHAQVVSVPFREYITQILFFVLVMALGFYLPVFLRDLFLSVSGADPNTFLSVFNF